MPTGEITLRDLIAWTDLVSPDTPGREPGGDPLDRDVDWVITARATPPMLPTLRGGELVLLPERVIHESALNLQLLIQELTSQPVAGVVLDTGEPVRSPIPVLRTARIGPELESDLNRMLTARRNDLLRAGADLERVITEQRGLHATPEELLRALAEHLELELVIRTASGAALIATGSPPTGTDTSGWAAHPLSRGRTLMLGPLTDTTRALGRYVLGRVAGAVQAALDAEAAAVSDHATRTRLLETAIRTAPQDPGTAAGMLRRAGIAPDATFRVVVGPSGAAEHEIWPLLRSLGTPVDGGWPNSHPWWLVLDTAPAGPPRSLPPGVWIAVSEPVGRPEAFATAVRQAGFLAAARAGGTIAGEIVRFDDLATVGVARLLYDHWGAPLLATCVETMLGPLLREDRRGQLRETLSAYLAFGGAQRPTAEHLGIHRNTLAYRLRQIRSLLPVDPDDPGARLNLHLALVASELPPPPAG